MTTVEARLKQQVEAFFGHTIATAADCAALAGAIRSATGEAISAQTLRRCWGIVRSKAGISRHTHDVLSRYIGYKDRSDFEQRVAGHIPQVPDLSPFETLFRKNQQHTGNRAFWHEGITQFMAEMILTNELVFEAFVIHLHANAGAMTYIMADYLMYDHLNKDWYMRGIRLFCRSSPVVHHQVYLASLECVGAMLNNRPEDAGAALHRMAALRPEMRRKHGTVWTLEGALLGCRVALAATEGDAATASHVMEEALALIAENRPRIFEGRDDYRDFVRTFCEPLLWNGLYDHCAEMMHQCGQADCDTRLWADTAVVWDKLLATLLLLRKGKRQQAKILSEEISLHQVRFDRKNLYAIFSLLVQLGLCGNGATKKKTAIRAHIAALTKATGMTLLNQRIPDFDLC